MAGFMSGLAQGIGNIGDDLANDRIRREELDLRKAAAAQTQKLNQIKQIGDLVKQYNDGLSAIPNEDTPEATALANQRTDMFAAQYEALTGQKINPMALKTLKQGGKDAANAMAEIYSDNPARFGTALTNVNAFTAVYDAYNARQMRIQSGDAFKNALGGATPGAGQLDAAQPATGVQNPQIAQIDQRMAALNNAASRLNVNSDLGKQQNDLIQKNLDILQKQRDQLLTGDTARMTRDEQPMSFQEAQAARVPVGTTYGEFRRMRGGGAAQPSAVAPQPSVGGTALPAAPSGGGGGFRAVPSKGTTPPALLDNLRATESGGNSFAINKQTKAMGPYQFMPETLAEMTKAGISFNPFVEEQARDAADRYITMLAQRHGGDYRKAMADYGGFVTKDPTAYVDKVMKGVQAAPTAAPAQAGGVGVPKTAAQLKQEEEIAKGGGETFNQMRTVYGEAIQDERRMKQLGSLLSGIDTGAAAPLTLAAQRGLQALGFKIDPKASQAEAAKALAIQMLGQTRKEAGGVGSTSNYENSIYAAGQAGIDKLPGANKILINAAIKSSQRTQKTFKEVAKYVKENGYDDVAIADIVARNQEENPIFSPEDANYLLGGKSGPAGGQSLIYSDKAKEDRYQEYKRKQLGGK